MSWILAVFTAFLLVGIPIAFALGLIGATTILVSGKYAYFGIIPNRMFGGLDNFVILAVPFFILAGALMNAGGVSERLIRFAMTLVGHFRGGLALVTVLTCMFFAGITGAATADAAAIGLMMIPAMERAGYGRDYGAALVATASLMGPIIPPSIVMVVYAVVAEVSIAEMFLGGVVPGVLIALTLIAMTVLRSWRLQIPLEPRASLREVVSAAIPALPAILLPVIIIGGIVFGVVTPTEAAALAVLLALVLGLFVYRDLRWSALPKIFGDTALISGAVLFIVATASVFAWVLTAERIPQEISRALIGISRDPLVLLLLMNVLLLVVGCFIEGVAAMLILVPVLLPAIIEAGISPVHFGIVMCLNLVLGFVTPPVGICLFVVCSIAKLRLEELVRAIWPFLIAMLVLLLAVTYYPPLVLTLPGYLK